MLFRSELCFIMEKLFTVCGNPIKRKVFETHYTEMTCTEILTYNKSTPVCDASDRSNASVIKANTKLSKFLFNYAQENLAVLNIFIKDPYYTSIESDEKMSLLFSIANAAGLLGLCIGPSIVTFFEVRKVTFC